MYDINLGATTTTTLSIRGVTIPIDWVSSATDSIRRHVVLFKSVTIPTSDPKSEFSCQSSLSCAEPTDPLNTSYAWDISHTLVTTYHPYCQSPSALTEYLKQKLCHQRVKRLGCSPSAQVEQNIPLEHNINSDFTLAATTINYLDRRGERNVPKRYLKEADWCEDGPLGTGYYIANPDDPSILIPVDFNFKYLQWGCTHKKKDLFAVERPAPTRYRLRIFDEERTDDRSHWGPIDGTPDEEEILDPNFKFRSEAGGDTPDPDIVIPRSSEEENTIAAIAQLIPSHITKPPIQPWSLAGAMAQIASTTTYHPYCHSPSALTEYLKHKLHHQRAKRLGHSPSAQVEQNVPLKHNINSGFTLAATTLEYLDWRGEQNVPKRYLKEADWCEDGPLGTGYYITNLDNPSTLIPIDFNFKHLQWGCTHKKKDWFVLERPAPTWYGLWIFDEERTDDRSHWGPLDGTPDEEETPDLRFKFGSEAEGDTPDPHIVIPKSTEEENAIAAIAQLIPSHITKPPPQPWSLAGAMAQIASTTTLTDSLVA